MPSRTIDFYLGLGSRYSYLAATQIDRIEARHDCRAADGQGALVACCRLIHRMVFVDAAVIDDAAIASIPGALGLDADRFMKALGDPATAARHHALLDEAQGRGAFGVPTFFLGDRMFWGNDRLVLLEAALGAR